MAVKVLIKRKISDSNKPALEQFFMKLRILAMQQPGYIGGETLKRVDAPNESLVISRWQTLDDWSAWLVSSERRDIQDRIDAITDAHTKFEIYEPC
ncbi:MAG: antibiotic biosynthesis monooxygenase [Desulfobacteraceae bacterium]